MLPPTQVYLLWTVALSLYVLWPFEVGDLDRRLLKLPLEYIPLLLVLGVGWFSGVVRGRITLPTRPRYLVLCAFGVGFYGVLSGLWVVDHRKWLEYFTMWVVYFTLFFGMVSTLSREDPEGFERFIDQYFFLLTIYTALIVVRRIVDPPPNFPHEFAPWNFSPIMRYRISQVLTILPFIPVAIRRYLVTGRPVYLAFLGIGSTDLLLSFSRAGTVGWFVVVILSFLIGRHDVFRVATLRRVWAVMATVGIAIGTTLAVSGIYWIQRLTSIFFIEKIWFGNLEGAAAISEVGARGRPILLREGIRIFSEHPWIGTGMGNYIEYFHTGPVLAASPHNFFLTYLSEFGVLGFVPLLAFFLYLVYFLWRRSEDEPGTERKLILQGFLVANISFLVLFLATDFMTSPYVWFFWGLSVAFALSASPDASGN